MNYFKEFEKNLAYHFSEVLNYPFAKPHWIYISLSHRCTYNCQMCGVVKTLKGYELSIETVKRCLDEIASWDWGSVVTLTGGEPLLRNDIFDIIGYSVKKEIKIECISNGSLIDKELAYKIINSGLQNIAISLDGAKAKTHDSIREKGSFLKAIGALKDLVSAKKRAGYGPQISVWTTIMKENVNELFDIISIAENLGVECLVYHPVIVAQDDMQNTPPDAPFWIRKGNLKILEKQIEKISAYRDRYGLTAFLHDPYLWFDYFKGTLTKAIWKCNPFVFINIGPDGEVRSCGDSFGNVNDSGLNESLYTKEAFRARRIMRMCKKPCLQTCWAHPESDRLIDITKSLVKSLHGSKGKKNYLKKAWKILDRYQNMV